MSARPKFITLEGTDGVGKTTHARRLQDWLERSNRKTLLTREPGGGPVSEKIRTILLDPKTEIEDLTELFLYQAARIEHVEKVIRPALQKGRTVICDRYTDATIAYQGFARGLSLKKIRALNAIATSGLVPDLTLWLDHPPRKALKKARSLKKKKGDRLENQGLKFQAKVRAGYKYLARTEPRRVIRIQVQPDLEATQDLIRKVVQRRFFR